MKTEELVEKILEQVGGKENVVKAENCMTRLRLTIDRERLVNVDALQEIDGVLGLVHDQANYYEVVVGPGVCRACADYCKQIGIGKNEEIEASDDKDWKKNKEEIKGKQKQNAFRRALKILGEIFVPLIPAVIASGLCGGFAALIENLVPGYKDQAVWLVLDQVFMLIKVSFLSYIGAWAGYRAAERFGGTPALGGMIGMITYLPQIADFATAIGINGFIPGVSLLSVGSGGVIAAIAGAWLVCKVEKFVRSKVLRNLDMIVTPLVSIIVVAIPYVLVIMPAAGIFSNLIAEAVQATIMSDNVIVRGIAGFVSAALFLPLVAMGMHHALIPIYTVQLNTIGYISLYPALCMGGFGQVGAALAIYIVAKKLRNNRIRKVISGSIVAGILGVGEPLIYGVTLPLFRPFITAGLGAGFGGALVAILQCGSVTWGPSGIIAIAAINAGPLGPIACMIWYLVGGIIATIMGFVITWFFMDKKAIREF